ncbi:MAG TPA: winged helix-turn-helix domain-containing protein [Polyangiaceae bacterium]
MLDLAEHTTASVIETSPTILLVEHEVTWRRGLRTMLEASGYEPLEASTGQEGLSICFTQPPHLVMIDQLLPDQTGVQLTRQIRESSDVPIIMVSPRDDEDAEVEALDSGANDYVVRPFRERELMARVRVALRWGRPPGSDPYTIGDLRVDPAQRRVFVRGSEVNLTPTEYRLLAVLMRQAGRVVTHQQLLKEVWGSAYIKEVQYLRVYMKQLRNKLEREPARPRCLLTAPGVGYRLKAQDEA